MKKQKNNKENRKLSLPFPYYILMIPVVMGLLLCLVVRGYSFKISSVFWQVSMAKGGTATDVFLHGKQVWLYIAVAVALFLLLCFKLLNRKIIYPKRWMIFGGAYLLCALVSALNAEDIKTAFFGGEDLFQGFFVIISYFILFYYIYMIFCSENKQRENVIFMFLRCVLVLSLIMTILGCFQVCGNDPFSWGWVQKICNIDGAQIIENKKIYLTLYNSNYVGVMIVLVLPLLVVGLIVEKIKWIRICFGVALIGLLGCLVASGSKTGMFFVTLIVVIGSIFVIAKRKKYRMVASLMLIVVIIAGATIGTLKKDTLLKINQPLKQQKTKLTGMSTESDCFELEVRGQKLSITWDGEGIQFLDEDGMTCETKIIDEKRKERLMKKLPQAMTSYYGEDVFVPKRIAKKPFKKVIFFKTGLKLKDKNVRGYVFYINKKPYFITNEWHNGEYYHFNLLGDFVKIYNSEDAFTKKMYGFASYRGYIWSKTIPLLKKTIFWGVGMDHFSLVFPNHDYAAKARIDKLGVIYNKPHSWYLQMAIEGGIVALLCIIIMILYILIEGIKGANKLNSDSNISGEKSLLKILLIGLGASIIGYCFMNILNDQMIVTAPVFWLILGAYAGVSNCLKED